MGYNTKIDWCDTSWNPVTGCRHGCEYCYAEKIANRFCPRPLEEVRGLDIDFEAGLLTLEAPAHKYGMMADGTHGDKGITPYPLGFYPTLHRYRLDGPKKWMEPRTIFVCSMADLFGNWIPDEWIKAVFDACMTAPQHRYLFLTKNPFRYHALIDSGLLPVDADNYWFGSTATGPDMPFFSGNTKKNVRVNTFLSVEPLLEDFGISHPEIGYMPDWVIIGAETGMRANRVIPEKQWIDNLVSACRESGIPVFMKESIRGIMSDDFIQEYPWEASL